MAKKDKQSIQSQIAQYLYTHQSATKAELARKLGVSMPTILSNVSTMMDQQILVPAGELDSTGGRKATALALNPDWAGAVGISITKSNLQFVLMDIMGNLLASQKIAYSFDGSRQALEFLADKLESFLADHPHHPPLLGCGIALPGIIEKKSSVLTRSHVLNLENYSLLGFEKAINMNLLFENDANAALLAERPGKEDTLVFLYLGRTVGGTLFSQGQIFEGDHSRAGEFGHMILYPQGRQCYCGKKGCADPYCSVSALTSGQNSQLEQFMKEAKAHPDSLQAKAWDQLLEDLALLCSNLRMAFDQDILIGGPLSPYLKGDLETLKEKIRPLDLFERNPDYLFASKTDHAGAAIGAAELLFVQKIRSL